MRVKEVPPRLMGHSKLSRRGIGRGRGHTTSWLLKSDLTYFVLGDMDPEVDCEGKNVTGWVSGGGREGSAPLTPGSRQSCHTHTHKHKQYFKIKSRF